MKDWTPSTILDAGGNIGISSVLFALLYPEATIITLEPERENCLLTKANTASFPHVTVHCLGLWNVETTVGMKHGVDGASWAWMIEEVPAGTQGAVKTTTVPRLLELHNLTGFDYAKIDIEFAEFAVFGNNTDFSWVKNTELLTLEVHGDPTPIEQQLNRHGFTESWFSEYICFASPRLHSMLSSL